MDNPDGSNNGSSQQGAPLWPTHAPPHFAYVSNAQPNQVLQVSAASSSQPNIAGFSPGQYPDTQYHNLQPFHLQQAQVFQQPQSSFDRGSPSVDNVDFQQVGASNADSIQFHGLSSDGAQILRNLPRSAVVTGFPVQVLIGQNAEASSMSIPVVSSVATSSGNVGGHSVVSVSDTSHPSTPLLQVVAAMQQFSQSDANSSEATPLAVQSPMQMTNQGRHDEDPDQSVSSMTYSLQHPSTSHTKMSQSHLETYTSEADTTQEDTPQSHHYNSHTLAAPSSHYRHENEYAEPESSDLPMSAGTLDQDLDPVSQSGLDSTMTDEVDMSSGMTSPMPGPSSRSDLLLDGHNTMMLLQAAAENERMTNSLTLPLVVSSESSNMAAVQSSSNVIMEEQKLRKSDRLAVLDRINPPVQAPIYQSTTYNTNELWCEDCQTTYAGECPKHHLVPTADKVVLSRAWASLPATLQIFRLGNTTELGVFAKKTIPKRSQFGPYIGELVDSVSKVSNEKFILQLDRENGDVVYFESSDENKCNWMMFVRPAQNYEQQNVVAYQYGSDIYYTTTKPIEPKQELLVWYAAHYAERLGIAVHPAPIKEKSAVSSEEGRWPCYECSQRFRTSAQLQQHLSEHDQGDASDLYELDEVTGQRRPGRRSSTQRAGAKVKVKRRAKKMERVSDDPSFQSWKKKKTSIYLNKHHVKQASLKGKELVKRSIKSLYRKKGKESGGQEWVCTHCHLTFDNSNLLNLHTLTHAAEDVGLHEIRRQLTTDVVGVIDTRQMADGMTAMVKVDTDMPGFSIDGNAENLVSLDIGRLECPVCKQSFLGKQELIEHASEHAKVYSKARSVGISKHKPYKCDKCWKSFTVQERLQKHMLCHGDENSKPLQCDVCFKRFMNNSALACHLKIHSDKKYYECQICHQGFDQILMLKSHVKIHMVNGIYNCPECSKQFDEYNTIRKHMRGFHSEKKYPCTVCNKIFPRPDKLKLHMLRHSAHREFMCESCGRQFKRKDKLKEHMKRMHTAEREAKMDVKPVKVTSKRFIPKVSPSDYHRFIYKCHSCMLGFKRRGMLVNHLAKRHPEVKPENVPELNLPILRTQRDYFCQYCDKVYKSSSKRKAHILKNHPGSLLPASSRKRGNVPVVNTDVGNVPNPTFSQTVGSVTTVPHPCHLCHKQYASKAKLMQHQRKKHPDHVPPVPERRLKSIAPVNPSMQAQPTLLQAVMETPGGNMPERYETETIVIQTAGTPGGVDSMQADLLTQAMSELTQSLSDYPNQATQFQIATTRLPNGHTAATLVQPALHGQNTATLVQPSQHSTIELSHLGTTLAHTSFVPPPQHQVQVVTEATSGVGGVVTSQPLSPQSLNAVVSSGGQQHVVFTPKTSWTTGSFPTYR